MNLLSLFFGGDGISQQRKAETENQIKHERGRLNQVVQEVQSGSRVMSNMAGMMTIMQLNQRIPDDEHD